jgi:serine/threonine protein phosphatase PrpC
VARALVGEIHTAVLASVAAGGNDAARSTLAFSVIRPEEGQIYWASIGDSHVFRAALDEVIELTGDDEQATFYLGSPHHLEDAMRARVRSGQESLAATRAMILSTDGLSEQGIGVDLPEAAVLEAVDRAVRLEADLSPLETARHLVEIALEAHRRHKAGDNMATAVHWL